MIPAWAQRQVELLSDCIVSPDVFASIKNARGTPPFRAGRKGRGPTGATAEPSGGVEAPAFTERPVFDRD